MASNKSTVASLQHFCFYNAGSMKGLAFIKDPDGYWIEILNPNRMARVD